MNAEEWERVQQAFLDSLEVPENEQEAFLREAFAGEEALAVEALRLMEAGRKASGFLVPPNESFVTERMRRFELDFSGAHFGEFELQAEIGRGNMGVVYRALQTSLGRTVAVKLLPLALARSPLSVERFRREALAASKLKHPHIAGVISFGEEAGVLYYAMEYVEGVSLEQILARRRTPGDVRQVAPDWADPYWCATLVATLADALHYAHDRGVIHRDVKPSNILIDERANAYLIDFGLAKDEGLERLTITGDVAGTPYYMSPEQARAAHDRIDRRTDIYSLGTVLYELLTLSPPFPGNSASEVLLKILNTKPKRVHQLAPSVPADVALVCHVAIEKRPADRYPSAAEFAQDLRRAAHRQRPLRRPPGAWTRAGRKLVERRAEALVLSLVLLPFFVAGFLLLGHLRARDPRIDVTVPGASGSATVRLIELSSPMGAPVRELQLGRAPIEDRRIEAGDYLLVVATEGGRTASFRFRARHGGGTAHFEMHPELCLPEAPEMVRVEGATIAARRQLLPRGTLDLGNVSIPAFLADRYPVTNGEYLRFLAEEPGVAERPSFWPPEDSEAWRLRPADFDRRPVTGIRLRDAEAYALAHGKRLPTLDEWRAAVQTAEGKLFPWGNDSSDLLERTTIVAERTSSAVRADEEEPWGWRDYLDHVQPVDRTERNPESGGIFDCYGNTWELTTTPMLAGTVESAIPEEDLVYGVAGCWNMLLHRPEPLTDGLNVVVQCSLLVPDPTIGFRCIRDLTPPSIP